MKTGKRDIPITGDISKEQTKEEKIGYFKQNIVARMFGGATNISHINNESFEELYGLMENPNLMIAQSPIFRYGDDVYHFGDTKRENVKYFVASVGDIEKYLKDGFIVILYTLCDEPYKNSSEFKYRILRINNIN